MWYATILLLLLGLVQCFYVGHCLYFDADLAASANKTFLSKRIFNEFVYFFRKRALHAINYIQ